MKIEYKNPEKRKGILIWEAEVNFLSKEKDFSLRDADELEMKKRAEKAYGEGAFYFPGSGREDRFLLWVCAIKDWESQRETQATYSIEGKKDYTDQENGNTIGFFDFSNSILGRKQLKISFSLESYETEMKAENWNTKDYEKSTALYRKYTKSERQLGQTDDIKSLAEKITGEGSGHFAMAKMIYNWITANVTYRASTGERGANRVFQSRDGNAAEMSFFCITLMRSIGIPARLVTGAWGDVGKKQDLHFWTEFYLQDVGWVPVDCAKKMFALLDNKRIIFSKGENIFLEKGPEESEVFKIKYKRVPFMQPEAVYLSKKEAGLFAVKQNKYLLIKE